MLAARSVMDGGDDRKRGQTEEVEKQKYQNLKIESASQTRLTSTTE